MDLCVVCVDVCVCVWCVDVRVGMCLYVCMCVCEFDRVKCLVTYKHGNMPDIHECA